MNPIDAILLTISSQFTRDIYFLITQIQGILWSIANSIIVYAFLKITGRIRLKNHRQKIRYRYFFLLLSILISPFLLATQKGNVFFTLEAAIYGIQYLILLYTLILERKPMMNYFKELISKTI